MLGSIVRESWRWRWRLYTNTYNYIIYRHREGGAEDTIVVAAKGRGSRCSRGLVVVIDIVVWGAMFVVNLIIGGLRVAVVVVIIDAGRDDCC